MKKSPIIIIIVIIAFVIVATQAFYKVEQTESALVVELGKPRRTVTDPGLHFKTPFIQQVIKFENDSSYMMLVSGAPNENND